MTDEPKRTLATPADPAAQRASDPRPARRPYTPPLVESGEAFERVQLQSGTGFGDPIDCPPQ